MQFPRRSTEDASRRRARVLAALTELGFRPATQPAATESERVDGQWRLIQVVAAMGTRVAVTAVDASRDRAEAALGAAWQRMDGLIGLLSRHDGTSALAVLNDQGRLAGPPQELVAVLEAARGLHRRSGGVFDPTVLPILELFERPGDGDVGFREPLADELTSALARVDAAAIGIGAGEIRFGREGTRVTLDGIAKGYIVDAIAAELGDAGLRDFLVDAGGDIRTQGSNAGQPWRVAVREPGAEHSLEVLSPRSGAVATSGSYEICYDDARTRHHLVRASDGRSPQECGSVTVFAGDAMSADALATTTFLLGPQAGLRFIESMTGCECLIVTRGGSKHRSRGWVSEPDAVPLRRTHA
jgi:thiamine biosynthesis lipoprotein